jgi:uncharacterized protein (DUF2147 family)
MKTEFKRFGYEIVFVAMVVGAFLSAAGICCAASSSIIGTWISEAKDAKIEIYKCGNKYCGKIVWMDAPYYAAEDTEGILGELKLDIKNPNPALRNRPILGLQILSDFAFSAANDWSGGKGKVYDPENGKTYSATMSLADPDHLYLRGYIIIPLFGRTAVWTRAEQE